MNPNPVVLNALATVSDAQLLEAASDQQLQRMVYRALDTLDKPGAFYDPVGLYIRSPRQIDMTTAAAWPVIVVSGESRQRMQAVTLGNNGILLIEALDRRAPLIRALLFAPPSPLKIPMPPSRRPPEPKPDPSSQSDHATVPIVVDLKKLEPPLPPGRYALTALEYDWKSNTTVIELIDGGKSQATKPSPWVDGAATEFQPSAAPTNTAPGVTLDAPITWSKRAASFQLRGQIRLPVERSWLTAGSASNAPQAEIPAHLVLVEKNVLWPQRTSFTIPVRGSKPLAAGDEISGTLRLDIKQPFERPATPGMYMAYVFLGSTVTGPFPVQLNE